jgi:hypothetical protein
MGVLWWYPTREIRAEKARAAQAWAALRLCRQAGVRP